MGNESNLRVRIGEYLLNRELKKNKRTPLVCNINKAKKVGVLFNASLSLNFEIIKNFVKDLSKKGVEVNAFGYIDNKSLIDSYLHRKGFGFFTGKDLSFFYKPKGEKIEAFINNDFDLLINLSLDKYLPIDYVTGLSKAKFKVGKFIEETSPLDFMIDTHKEMDTLKKVKKEVESKGTNYKKANDLDSEMDKKARNEIQLNFLINQIIHYLSIINN
jgi:hypothetical protein